MRKLEVKYKKIFDLATPYYKKGRRLEDIHHLVVTDIMKYTQGSRS